MERGCTRWMCERRRGPMCRVQLSKFPIPNIYYIMIIKKFKIFILLFAFLFFRKWFAIY